jgi:hypothetical protein
MGGGQEQRGDADGNYSTNGSVLLQLNSEEPLDYRGYRHRLD